MAYYPSNCNEIPTHQSCTCEAEMGRVRGVALIHKSFYNQVIIDPENPVVWQAGVNLGMIVLLPETNGEYNADPINGRGYGYSEETFVAFNHIVTYQDPDFYGNVDHYNAINGSRNYYLAFITETMLHLEQRPCNLTVNLPIKNSVKDDVLYTITARWTHDQLPQQYLKLDNVFVCNVSTNVYGASFDNSFDDSFDIP